MNTEEFIKKANIKHNNKYNYSKTIYNLSRIKVCIICPEHGEFWQTPNDHLSGYGCPECGKISKKKYTLDIFKKKAQEIHGNRYDYSKVNYTGMNNKVCIICPEHGEFFQTPNNHINNKKGCKKCADKKLSETKKKYTTESFIELSKNIFGENTYDYSKTVFNGVNNKLCITCPKHGDFWVTPNKHLRRNFGCRLCGIERRSKNRIIPVAEIINQANYIHNNKYEYDTNSYKNTNSKMRIICPIHGEFWQSPTKHIKDSQGCPKCKAENNIYETRLYELIKNEFKDFTIIREYSPDFLGKLRLDIFIKELSIAIEYQGKQHFSPVNIFGGEKGFKKTVERDQKKYELCKKNNIKLYYFDFNKNEIPDIYLDTVYYDSKQLFEAIRKDFRGGSGMKYAIEHISDLDEVSITTFTDEDIVRNPIIGKILDKWKN